MHIADGLHRAARLWPDQPAVICDGRTTSYRELRRRCQVLAGELAGLKLRPGDRVAALLHNGASFIEAYHAAALAGVILVPLNTRLAPLELRSILRDCGARLLLADADLQETARATVLGSHDHAVELVIWCGDGAADAGIVTWEGLIEHEGFAPPPRTAGGDEVAHLYYTSGTTGRPKGVMLTHANVVSHALGTVAELHLSDADRWLHAAPMFHLADAWATFAITMVGGRHVVLPRFDAAAALRLMRDEGVTITNLVPTMLNRMVNDPSAAAAPFPALRAVMSGGAPIAPALVRSVMETFGCTYVQTYGMTETSPYLTLSLLKHHLRDRPDDERFAFRARTGREFITVALRVVGDDGEDVPADGRTVGEIRVRGDSVTPGYWNRPGSTAAAFEDGWLRTGDLAVIDDEGYVDIVDRRKDMIITGGENVYSTEVENALYEHPGVLEAAVIGLPDETWDEAVTAVVVPRPDAAPTADELVAHCKQRLASYKAPKRVFFVDELPRTGSGKITKRTLRERFGGEPT